MPKFRWELVNIIKIGYITELLLGNGRKGMEPRVQNNGGPSSDTEKNIAGPWSGEMSGGESTPEKKSFANNPSRGSP